VGTKRLILEEGYYESFNQDNVTLVDGLLEPITEVTPSGVRTSASHYEADVLVFAIGFRAFLGPLQDARISNDAGVTPADVWARGPRTLFGLMTPGFPNMFHPVSAGSPSVLGNAMLQHEFTGDWIAAAIARLDHDGKATIEASDHAAGEWTDLVDDCARRMFPIRRSQDQYMVHVNNDGSRFFIPFCAGMGEYAPLLADATSDNYRGFALS
jgi:cation diffusion facilitator CzcD-associated flavoprotein CzcO